MTYTVLARKWRPRSFEALVGQEHVVRTFVHALDHGRLHHAYLFTGTRGVGKTTLARIVAKALNCEQGVSARPCGECSACTEIDAGRFVDLIEVDAASRTKVEDTRELLENVQYVPTRGRYKVYLIDEVHMLSNHSFNALLKTLEEPPPHVVFLLATTDPQRLPATVLSRCLQFHLRRLPPAQIQGYLAQVAAEEGVEGESEAFQGLAQAADGSMRDALSLLDQAIAYSGGRLTTAAVRDMLGVVEARQVTALAEALARGDGAAVMAQIAALAETAPDYGAVLGELLALLHRLAVVQTVPEAGETERWDSEVLRRLADLMGAEDVQLYYQIGLIGRRDLGLAPDPRDGFEMVLLRMLAFRPVSAPLGGETTQDVARARSVRVPQAAAKPPVAPPSSGRRKGSSEWESIVAALDLEGVALQLAANCQFGRRKAGLVELVLAPSHASLRGGRAEERLSEALSAYYKQATKVIISVESPQGETPAAAQLRRERDRRAQAEDAIERDDVVRALKETFDARIVPDSIEPSQ